MRINKYVALATGMSRRAADAAIEQGRVNVNGKRAAQGQEITETQQVILDGILLHAPEQMQTIVLNKPAGYVVSRQGQGAKTIYDLLPKELHPLKPIGRLDKDSSGLLLLTNNGALANELTHPRYQKEKIYEIELHKPLLPTDQQTIKKGLRLPDGVSNLKIDPINDSGLRWHVHMREGRNRQIRRTFQALGYKVTKLHRTHFGPYSLENLPPGHYRRVTIQT